MRTQNKFYCPVVMLCQWQSPECMDGRRLSSEYCQESRNVCRDKIVLFIPLLMSTGFLLILLQTQTKNKLKLEWNCWYLMWTVPGGPQHHTHLTWDKSRLHFFQTEMKRHITHCLQIQSLLSDVDCEYKTELLWSDVRCEGGPSCWSVLLMIIVWGRSVIINN